jgi:hypothetical protein
VRRGGDARPINFYPPRVKLMWWTVPSALFRPLPHPYREVTSKRRIAARFL